jgi:hypothetical protein
MRCRLDGALAGCGNARAKYKGCKRTEVFPLACACLPACLPHFNAYLKRTFFTMHPDCFLSIILRRFNKSSRANAVAECRDFSIPER